jgi:hypothetical protein
VTPWRWLTQIGENFIVWAGDLTGPPFIVGSDPLVQLAERGRDEQFTAAAPDRYPLIEYVPDEVIGIPPEPD